MQQSLTFALWVLYLLHLLAALFFIKKKNSTKKKNIKIKKKGKLYFFFNKIIVFFFYILGSTSFQNVVIATEDGKLIEFSNKYIINKCAIDMKNVNMISLFKVYNPNLRYFLLYDSSSLHIISTKNNTFKVK